MNKTVNFILGIKQKYTIHRILMGQKLSDFQFADGLTIDVGGEIKSSYEDLWKTDKKSFYYIDISGTPNILADINSLPFKNKSLSNFGSFNILELIQNPGVPIQEIFQVLRNDGFFVGYVPFLYPIHNQPTDYWRFSKATLFDLLNNAGFKDIYIEAIGGRFIVFYDVILPKKLFPLRLILSSICLLLNKLYEKFHSAEYNREMYPSGYFFIAKK